MPEEGKTLNPDHPCFRPEPGKVESLVTLLNNSSEMKLVWVASGCLFLWRIYLPHLHFFIWTCFNSQVKWHEICLSTPAAILEVLNAWENGVLSVEAVQVSPHLRVIVFLFLFCFCCWNRSFWLPKQLLLIVDDSFMVWVTPLTSVKQQLETCHIISSTFFTHFSFLVEFHSLWTDVILVISSHLSTTLCSIISLPLFFLSVEDHWQHQGEGVQHGHLCSGMAGGARQDAGTWREREASDYDSTACNASLCREHSAVLQRTVQTHKITHCINSATLIWAWTGKTVSLIFQSPFSVVIMSSIMEHMCADVFQQTGALLRSPIEGLEPIPYRNLLPPKEPIHNSLSKQFQVVLRKGWVDSQALHLFESLLNMGGVFWFTNNLVKVTGLNDNVWELTESVPY